MQFAELDTIEKLEVYIKAEVNRRMEQMQNEKPLYTLNGNCDYGTSYNFEIIYQNKPEQPEYTERIPFAKANCLLLGIPVIIGFNCFRPCRQHDYG